MRLSKLGSTDLHVSHIGLGCVTFGREIDEQTSLAIMDHALAQGITLFDTAEAYAAGQSETVLGNWIAGRNVRDRIVLATKVHGVLTRERILSSVDASLLRLRTDYIDLLQAHVWDSVTPLEDTLAAFTTLAEQGKVRYVGCSNYSALQLEHALSLSRTSGMVRMACVQPPYNLVQREIETDLLPLCVQEDIGVITYSPLAAGFLTGKYRPGQPVPEGTRFDVIPGHQPIYFTDHGFRVLEQLDEAAAHTGKSHVQLALSWVLQQPHVDSVLIGARNTAQVDQALAASAGWHTS
ncbi:MAG: aldo/keto reductase [Planctomycetaceae bacterium]